MRRGGRAGGGERAAAARAARRRPVPHARRPGRRGAPPLGRRHHGSRSTSASVLLDGRLHWFVAHLVARRSWWRGRVVAAMNAQWLGALGPRPRGPPQRRAARRRRRADLAARRPVQGAAPAADGHPPAPSRHPRARGAGRSSSTSTAPLAVWLDGERVGAAATCRSGSSPTPSPSSSDARPGRRSPCATVAGPRWSALGMDLTT